MKPVEQEFPVKPCGHWQEGDPGGESGLQAEEAGHLLQSVCWQSSFAAL